MIKSNALLFLQSFSDWQLRKIETNGTDEKIHSGFMCRTFSNAQVFYIFGSLSSGAVWTTSIILLMARGISIYLKIVFSHNYCSVWWSFSLCKQNIPGHFISLVLYYFQRLGFLASKWLLLILGLSRVLEFVLGLVCSCNQLSWATAKEIGAQSSFIECAAALTGHCQFVWLSELNCAQVLTVWNPQHKKILQSLVLKEFQLSGLLPCT